MGAPARNDESDALATDPVSCPPPPGSVTSGVQQVGWLLLLAAILGGLGAVAAGPPADVRLWLGLALLLVAVLGVAIVAAVRLGRPPATAQVFGALCVTSLGFALLLGRTNGLAGWLVVLVLPVLGGLELRRAGAVVGTIVAILGIAGNAWVATRVWDLDLAATTLAAEVAVTLLLGWLCTGCALRSQRQQASAEESRRASEALAARERGLAERFRELDVMRTSFLAVTSHELRTPLTAINGFAATLLRPGMDVDEPTARDMLQAIHRHAGRLTRLVSDLQTVTSLDSRTMEFRLAPVDVRVVMAEVVSTVPDGRVRLHGPHVHAVADAERLFQVLTNLVSNGLDHGGDVVTITWAEEAGRVVVRVTDDGPGIPPQDRERVFERFVRVGARGGHPTGQGLGLAISRELAERMNGSLRIVETPAGQHGAAFALDLPAAPPEHGRPLVDDGAAASPTSVVGDGPEVSRAGR